MFQLIFSKTFKVFNSSLFLFAGGAKPHGMDKHLP
jgi:hypothetical protein